MARARIPSASTASGTTSVWDGTFKVRADLAGGSAAALGDPEATAWGEGADRLVDDLAGTVVVVPLRDTVEGWADPLVSGDVPGTELPVLVPGPGPGPVLGPETVTAPPAAPRDADETTSPLAESTPRRTVRTAYPNLPPPG